ncbi:ABC transporter permease [Desulfosporosinus sp. SYSU MS00001]
MRVIPGLIFVKRNFPVFLGGLIIAFMLSGALFAPFLTNWNPLEVSSNYRLLSPSSIHLMGTDQLGRDIQSRILYGARTSMEVGFSVVLISTLSGVILGLVSGYYKKVGSVVMRVIDGFMAFPGIIVAIFMAAVWGPGKLNIIMALSFAYFSRMTRVVRGAVLPINELEFINSAKTAGAADRYILTRYILANILSPIIVQATFIFALAILDEAALSFLGVGIKAPEPSWGSMVSEAKTYMQVAPWTIVFPGGAIALAVLGLNLFGDGLRDMLDPRLRLKG